VGLLCFGEEDFFGTTLQTLFGWCPPGEVSFQQGNHCSQGPFKGNLTRYSTWTGPEAPYLRKISFYVNLSLSFDGSFRGKGIEEKCLLRPWRTPRKVRSKKRRPEKTHSPKKNGCWGHLETGGGYRTVGIRWIGGTGLRRARTTGNLGYGGSRDLRDGCPSTHGFMVLLVIRLHQ